MAGRVRSLKDRLSPTAVQKQPSEIVGQGQTRRSECCPLSIKASITKLGVQVTITPSKNH